MKSLFAVLALLICFSASNVYASDEDNSQHEKAICTIESDSGLSYGNKAFPARCEISKIYKDHELIRRYSTCENKLHDFHFAQTQVEKLEKAGVCVYLE